MEHRHGRQWDKPPYDFIVTNGRSVYTENLTQKPMLAAKN